MVELTAIAASRWGGPRPGAGRPRLPRSESHRRRPPVSPTTPHHLTLRVARGVWNLRAQRCFRPLCAVLAAMQRDSFRVVHYSVQGNHLHLIVEAADRAALVYAVRGLAVRVARALNRVMGRKGPVLGRRTHTRALTSPSQVRNAVRYVLQNRAHHFPTDDYLDPCSSAPWFADWASLGVSRPRTLRGPDPPPCVAARPRTWLLRAGYVRAIACAR